MQTAPQLLYVLHENVKYHIAGNFQTVQFSKILKVVKHSQKYFFKNNDNDVIMHMHFQNVSLQPAKNDTFEIL